MYDIVVIGGGMLGVSVARDAAGRGLSVCLFEQEDFGAGASGRGSRLVTGGLNALETMDFTRVREDIREREILRRTAPHLVQPQPCLIPFYGQGVLAQTRLRASLALTDALGFDQSLPVHHLLSPSEARARAPGLRSEGLTGAALVSEAAVPRIERLALELALDARRHGAHLRTHTRVEALCREREPRGRERVVGVRWRDRLTGEEGRTDAGLVVAAAGAWQSELEVSLGSQPRLVKSVSLIGPSLPGRGDALVFPREEEGRLLVVTPWPNGSWVGSIESDFVGDLDTAHATGDEVAALVRLVRDFLPDVAWDDPALAQAAVRASLPPHAASFGVAAPTYAIQDHGADGGVRDGLVTVVGGRVTSARAIAEEVVDLVCRKLGRALSTPPCRTDSTPLPMPAGPAFDGASLDDAALRAAVEWAVAEEECCSLRDFFKRRAPLAGEGRSAVPVVLETMASLLGWDGDRRAREVKVYEADRALTQAFRVL
jgi:glycerol-3-phosphate dehydrogenase